eukprot:scaffold7956_cov390-Prasinococcus_capsulatus_cf.AAC.1
MARTADVFPVPGGPVRSTARGCVAWKCFLVFLHGKKQGCQLGARNTPQLREARASPGDVIVDILI